MLQKWRYSLILKEEKSKKYVLWGFLLWVLWWRHCDVIYEH